MFHYKPRERRFCFFKLLVATYFNVADVAFSYRTVVFLQCTLKISEKYYLMIEQNRNKEYKKRVINVHTCIYDKIMINNIK